MTDLVTTGSDLSALSIEQINWLLEDAGSELTATEVVLVENLQWLTTHFATLIFKAIQESKCMILKLVI